MAVNAILEELRKSYFDAYAPWIEQEAADRGDEFPTNATGLALWRFSPREGARVFMEDEIRLPAGRPDPGCLATLDVQPTIVIRGGWIGFLFSAREGIAVIDHRDGWAEAQALLDLAAGYYRTGRAALDAGCLGPAVENAWAAAQLATMAILHPFDATSDHRTRQDQLSRLGEIHMVPAHHAETLRTLKVLRGTARYGDAPLPVGVVEVDRHLASADNMIHLARFRISEGGS